MTETNVSDLRALVVDDDPASAKLFAVVLRLEGCDVRTTASAEEARGVLASFKPHIAVVDLVLPQMSGLTFISTLSASPLTQDIGVIAVSAINGPAVEKMALQAGSAAYLRKPVEPATLLQTIARIRRGKS